MAPEWQNGGYTLFRRGEGAQGGHSGCTRMVMVVLATTALWALISGLFQPFLPLSIASLEGSATDVGLAGAVTGLAYLLAEGMWGLTFDRVGGAGPLAISKVRDSRGIRGYLARTDLWWIYLLQFLARGFRSRDGGHRSGSPRQTRPREGRGTVMGMYVTTQTLTRSGTGIIGAAS